MCTISPRPNRRGRGTRCVQYTKKKPVLSYGLFFKYGGEGGLTRFARPAGSPLTAFTVCPTGCRQLSNPGRGFSSPGVCNIRKKSPYFRTSSSLNMAVRGGLTRFARPAGSPLTAFTVCPTGCRQLSNPGRGFSSPGVCNIRKKSPYFRTSSSLNMAVRGDSNPDTLPYTHFPGVLLQPLGHLTKLSFLSCWNGR